MKNIHVTFKLEIGERVHTCFSVSAMRVLERRYIDGRDEWEQHYLCRAFDGEQRWFNESEIETDKSQEDR